MKRLNDGREALAAMRFNGGPGMDNLRGDHGADRFCTRDSSIDDVLGGNGNDRASADDDDITAGIETT